MGEKHEKLYLQVYNGIRDYIIKNHLQPGDVLPSEMEMTKQSLLTAMRPSFTSGIFCIIILLRARAR